MFQFVVFSFPGGSGSRDEHVGLEGTCQWPLADVHFGFHILMRPKMRGPHVKAQGSGLSY